REAPSAHAVARQGTPLPVGEVSDSWLMVATTEESSTAAYRIKNSSATKATHNACWRCFSDTGSRKGAALSGGGARGNLQHRIIVVCWRRSWCLLPRLATHC